MHLFQNIQNYYVTYQTMEKHRVFIGIRKPRKPRLLKVKPG